LGYSKQLTQNYWLSGNSSLVIVSGTLGPKVMVLSNLLQIKAVTQKTYFNIFRVAEKQLFASQ
jgi:hypothetical protein